MIGDFANSATISLATESLFIIGDSPKSDTVSSCSSKASSSDYDMLLSVYRFELSSYSFWFSSIPEKLLAKLVGDPSLVVVFSYFYIGLRSLMSEKSDLRLLADSYYISFNLISLELALPKEDWSYERLFSPTFA